MSSCRPKMSKFRLKIDLSQFYDDERHLAYVLADSKWDQVSCLEEHVEKVFDVAKVHFLTEDGIFIPSKESIDVIRGSDYLKAFMPQRLRKLRKKRLIVNGYDGFGDEAHCEEVVGDKRKHSDSGTISCSTPNGPARKKRRTSVDLTIDALRMKSNFEETPLHSMLGSTSPKSNSSNEAVTSTNNSPRRKKSSLDLSKLSETRDETVKTRRKKRLRKRRRSSAERSGRLSSVPVPISSSTLRLSKSMGTPKGAAKHVHFDENATLVQDNGENRVVFCCRLNRDGTLQPREIDTEDSDEVPSPPKKPKIQIQENLLLVEGKDSSTDCENTSVIEIEDSLLKPPGERVRNVDSDISNFSVSSATVDQILPVSAPLLGLPKSGDIILFKMFRLSEESASDLSEYICAMCEDVDTEKRKVICTILDGLDQIEESARRCPQGNGDGQQGGGNCFEFFLDELMDTRIFRMS